MAGPSQMNRSQMNPCVCLIGLWPWLWAVTVVAAVAFAQGRVCAETIGAQGEGPFSKTASGRALLTQGVRVELPEEMSSEIITIRHVGR